MLINIFGGITRGDVVARGIVAGLKAVETNLPIVIRLVGHQLGRGAGASWPRPGCTALESMDEAAAQRGRAARRARAGARAEEAQA